MNLAEPRMNILERDLKVMRRPAQEGNRAFVPIPLAVLMPEERLTFPLFLKVTRTPDQEVTYSPCLEEGEALRGAWLEKLGVLGLDQVYFHDKDLDKAIAYLNNHLLLQSRRDGVWPEELLVLREHLGFSMRLALNSPQLAQAAGMAKESVQQLLTVLEREDISWKLIWNLLYQDYTLYNHSVNVSVLGVSLAVFLQRSRTDCLTLGMAGLFHDVGLTLISEEILQKKEPLTGEEWEAIKKHPCLGYRLLKGNAGFPLAAMRLVLEHHELADGTGYPQGLPLKRQHPLSRVLSLLEAYDGLTIYPPYRQRQSPYAALKILQEQRGDRGPAFDPSTLKKFIEFLAAS